MLEKLLNYLEDKKILILGYGLEGESSYRFLRKHFPEKNIFIADQNLNLLNNKIELIEDSNVEVSLGENYLNGIEEYDLILKAPGISLKDVDISKYKEKIISQLQLFLEFIDVYTIGVTGTKGKSTTSSLIYKVLLDQGKDVFLLGNIGEPIFDDIDYIEKDSIVVLELSSHALEYISKSPNIAILLDIFEEHLDHYKTFKKYVEAKFNIARFQKDSDYFIYNYDNKAMNDYDFSYKKNDYAISLQTIPSTIKNKVYLHSDIIYCNGKAMMNMHEKMNLKGLHNINNIMFALSICEILKLDIKKTINSIKNFKTLEHRMEFVGILNGVEYYNDSIATIPEATINAINALKNVNTIIVGGKDRGVDLSDLINFLEENEQIENIICLPKTGEYIKEGLRNSNKKVVYKEKLEEAVEVAMQVTKKGTACLLSPAASSYGYFKNFEERGKLFKKYVLDGIL